MVMREEKIMASATKAKEASCWEEMIMVTGVVMRQRTATL